MDPDLLRIDRRKPFQLQDIGASSLEGVFEIQDEDPRAKGLTSIDLSKVRVEPLMDTSDEHPTNANELLQQSIRRLTEQGLTFLDVYALSAFLANPTLIPPSWIRFADGDAAHTSGLEFRGTVFGAPAKPDQKVHFGMHFNRGSWSYWHNEATYSASLVESFAKDRWGSVVRYAVVYEDPRDSSKRRQ